MLSFWEQRWTWCLDLLQGMGQLDAVIPDGDDMTAVEVADTPLKSFLAHSEDLFDGLGVSLVAVGALSPWAMR